MGRAFAVAAALLLAAAALAARPAAAASLAANVTVSEGSRLEPEFDPAAPLEEYRLVLGFGVAVSVVEVRLVRGTLVPDAALTLRDGATGSYVLVDTDGGGALANQTLAFRADARSEERCGGDLQYCNGNGECVPGVAEADDTCDCYRGFVQESCDILNGTWEAFISAFVLTTLLSGAAACVLSLLAAAASGFHGEIFTPMALAVYLQHFVLFISHNEDSRQFFDPYQIMNFLMLNLFRDEGGTEREGSYLVYMHGIGRKWVLFAVVVFFYVWLPGRYLVTCVFKASVKAQHLTWIFLLMAAPLMESLYDLTSSGLVTPAELRWLFFGLWLVVIWSVALFAVRPQLTDDVRLFLLPGNGGWGRFHVNAAMRRDDESFCGMLRRKASQICTASYVPPGERRHRKRWHWRFWIYATEEEARKHASPEELEAMKAARGRQAVLVSAAAHAAATEEARKRAASEAAVTTFEEADEVVRAAEERRKRNILDEFVPIANLSQIKMVGPDDADEDAVTDAEADAWARFGHQNLVSRVAYYAPFSAEEAAAASLPRRALRAARSSVGLYWTFVELSFLALVVLVATLHNGEQQPRELMYVYGAELLLLLVLVPLKNDEMLIAVLVRCALVSQLWMYRRMLRDREEVGLMLPISIILVAMLPVQWLLWAYFNQDLEAERRRRNAVILMKGHIRRRRAAMLREEEERVEEERRAAEAEQRRLEELQEREVDVRHVFVAPGRRGKRPKASRWFEGRDPERDRMGIAVERTVVVHRPPEKKTAASYDAIDLEAGGGGAAGGDGTTAEAPPLSARARRKQERQAKRDAKQQRKKDRAAAKKAGDEEEAAESNAADEWLSSGDDEDAADEAKAAGDDRGAGLGSGTSSDDDDDDGSDNDGPRRAAPPANLSQHNLLDYLKQQAADEAARKRYESTQRRK